MSTQKKTVKLSDCQKAKRVPPTFHTSFTDTYNLYLELQNADPKPISILSTGSLDPNALSIKDHGLHGAMYISIDNMPQFFDKKKFGTNAKLKKHFLDCQEFANTYIGPHMSPGTSITVEICGIQNREYNKTDPIYPKSLVIPHGSIVAKLHEPKTLTKESLDALCENSIFEGYVVLDSNSGNRFKLKREYFNSKEKPGIQTGLQRGPHKIKPTLYTDSGLKLCNGFSYDNAVISALLNNVTDETIIAKMPGADLVLVPISQVIQNQLQFPFDGDKMLNLFQTSGKGETYKYSDTTIEPDILGKNLQFQLKFDGETGILHKDVNGKIHLLVKFQTDIYEIESDKQISYRFGFL